MELHAFLHAQPHARPRAREAVLWFGGYPVSRQMMDVLICHVEVTQTLDVRNVSRHKTVQALLHRGWLRFRTDAGRETILSAKGRPAAHFALAAEADRLVAEDVT